MQPETVFDDYRVSFRYLNKRIDELLAKGWRVKDHGFLIAPDDHPTTRNHWASTWVPIFHYDKVKKTEINVLIPHWLLTCDLECLNACSEEGKQVRPLFKIFDTYKESFHYLNKKIDELIAKRWRVKLHKGDPHNYGFFVAPDNHKTTKNHWAGEYLPILHRDKVTETDIKVLIPHWLLTCDLNYVHFSLREPLLREPGQVINIVPYDNTMHLWSDFCPYNRMYQIPCAVAVSFLGFSLMISYLV